MLASGLELNNFVLGHLGVGEDSFLLIFPCQDVVKLVILFLSRTEQEPVFGKADGGENGGSVKVLYFYADHLLSLSLGLPQHKLNLENVPQLTRYEEKETFKAVYAVAGELGLPRKGPALP